VSVTDSESAARLLRLRVLASETNCVRLCQLKPAMKKESGLKGGKLPLLATKGALPLRYCRVLPLPSVFRKDQDRVAVSVRTTLLMLKPVGESVPNSTSENVTGPDSVKR